MSCAQPPDSGFHPLHPCSIFSRICSRERQRLSHRSQHLVAQPAVQSVLHGSTQDRRGRGSCGKAVPSQSCVTRRNTYIAVAHHAADHFRRVARRVVDHFLSSQASHGRSLSANRRVTACSFPAQFRDTIGALLASAGDHSGGQPAARITCIPSIPVHHVGSPQRVK